MARGDVVRVRLPDQGGHEQLGERPAVAVQTEAGSSDFRP